MTSLLQERRPASPVDERRICAFCDELLTTTEARARFCGQRCRQSAFRLRRRRVTETKGRGALRFAYADPPYPGTAAKYYRREATFAGEVDHRALVSSLLHGGYAGWALSTSAKALGDVLPLCPTGARVCAWVKPHHPSVRTYGLHNCWEPLIVVGGRAQRPGKRDWLQALPARGLGVLPGRKPLAFCAWLFECLGMLPGDELVDLYPGTGIVTRAWAELSRGTAAGGVWIPDAPSRVLERRSAARPGGSDAGPANVAPRGATVMAERKIAIINRTPFELRVESFDDGTPASVTFMAHAGVIGERGVCGDCGELRELYLNSVGPNAICELCLVNRPVRAESL